MKVQEAIDATDAPGCLVAAAAVVCGLGLGTVVAGLADHDAGVEARGELLTDFTVVVVVCPLTSKSWSSGTARRTHNPLTPGSAWSASLDDLERVACDDRRE